MVNQIHNTSRVNVLCMLISILLITISSLGILGKLLFWGMLLYSYVGYLYSREWRWSINTKYIGIILILLGWMLIRAQNLLGMKYFILMCILMGVYISNIPYKNISKSSLLILFITTILMGISVIITGEFYTNKNIGSIITAIIVVLVYIRFPKYRKAIILIGLPMIMAYDARSVILGLGMSLVIIYLVKQNFIKLKALLLSLLLIISIGLYLVWDILMSPEFNKFIFETTNKNFQSGRNLIWGAVFDYMKGFDWVIGVGGGVDHGKIVPETYKNMSLHSSYVFMIFHYGIIGLSLLSILFYKILNNLINQKYYYSATILLFLIIRDFFEITLINNQMAIAVMFWGWIANGWIDRSKYKVSNEKKRPINNTNYNKLIESQI